MSANSETIFWPWDWSLPIGKGRLYPVDLALVIAIAGAIAWLTVFGWKSAGDVNLYRVYADAFWKQAPVGHALPREYPPLAILVFSLTLIPDRHDYQIVFAAWMALAFVVGYLMMAVYSTRRRSLAYVGLIAIGIAPFVMARYDIIPALITLAALYAALGRRYALAYTLLAVGVVVKIYPAFLIPLVMIAQWRDLTGTPAKAPAPFPRAEHQRVLIRIGAGLGIGVALIAFVFGVAWLLNPDGVFAAFSYASQRPTQVESTWSTIVWLATRGQHDIQVLYTFGSNNWTGHLSQTLASLATPALGLGALVAYFLQWRGKIALPQAFLAVLCIIVLTNKVFSTQYLIWLLPIAAEAEGFDLAWVLVGVLTILEVLYFPFNHIFQGTELRNFMIIITARNALLIFITLRLLTGRRFLPYEAPPPHTSTPLQDDAETDDQATLKRSAVLPPAGRT